jgi:peptidoglycan/xylan/chitin deacetylase (PgdA/CDA1 family)
MKAIAPKLKSRLAWTARHTRHQLLKRYADFRVGATPAEKRAYKPGPSILLTFDDYGSPAQVRRLLQILEQHDVRGMFFLQGDWADGQAKLVQAIAAAGHIIGNHTYSHADLLSLTNAQVADEIRRGPRSTWLRPPRGRYNRRVRSIAQSLGYRICYWSIDSDDWQGVAPDYISRKVLAELHPGAVILFHLHADNTLRALPGLIRAIRAQGFELHSLDEPDWSAK